MSRISNLYRVQEIDLDLSASQTRIEEIEQILAQDEEIRIAETLLGERKEQLAEARAANSSADHAVASQREKIAQTEKALYGGTISNPKELQDLQMEAESLRRHLVTLEDRYLEAMVALEQVEEAHLLATEALDVLQQRQARQYKQLTEEKDNLIAKLARLDEERQTAVADVSPDDLQLYEALRGRLADRPLAILHDGVCSACGVELARSKQQEVATGSDLIRCSQCSRILYAG